MGGVYDNAHFELDVGDTVWANYWNSGYFYQAEITEREKTNLGRYTLQYHEADIQTRVDAENIMVLPTFSQDDEVWALHPTTMRFTKTSVNSFSNGIYKVDFDDMESEADIEASLDHIRPVRSFQKYDTVWLDYKQGLKWYKGEVTGVNPDWTYRVHTDDGKVEENATDVYMYLIHRGRAVTAGPHTKYITKARASALIDQEDACCAALG